MNHGQLTDLVRQIQDVAMEIIPATINGRGIELSVYPEITTGTWTMYNEILTMRITVRCSSLYISVGNILRHPTSFFPEITEHYLGQVREVCKRILVDVTERIISGGKSANNGEILPKSIEEVHHEV